MQELSQDRPVLVIDLDGTLLRSDMLYESFWSSFAHDWRTPLWAAAGITRGRAALKERLAQMHAPDPATLPYNQALLDHIRTWRASGGRTALVTATDQRLASGIAAHLDLFDEVHGSDGTTNLKGENKAAFLRDHFGEGKFIYAGDNPADLAVWEHAANAITVGASRDTREKATQRHPSALHLSPATGWWKPALKAMRPHQWLKNLLVFLPILTSQNFAPSAVLHTLLAFVAFSVVASSVYLLNDLLDIGPDRAHPRKRFRPLASGDLSLAKGMMLVPILLGTGLIISALLGPVFLFVLAIYYGLTIAYSLWLKRQPIIDICSLAVLYTLRVAAGAAATLTVPSVWLLAFSLFLFFSLAAVKRQAELTDLHQRGETSATGRGYRVTDLPLVMQIGISSGFVAVMVLMLYLNDHSISRLYTAPELLWGSCLVLLFWITRMVLIAHRGKMHDDPIVFAARDITSIVCFGLIGVIVYGASVI